MTRTPLLALYSLAHFWVDLSCALLAFRSLSASPDFALCLLLYNFCAFALQMPLGLLADRLDRNGAAAAAGCALVALAYAVPLPLAAAVTAGVGNALFHLGGGIDTLNTGLRRSAALGIFVSPGAVGLFLGTLWGRGDAVSLWAGPVGLLVLAGAILWLCRRTFGSLRSGNAPVDAEPAGGSWLPLGPPVPGGGRSGPGWAWARASPGRRRGAFPWCWPWPWARRRGASSWTPWGPAGPPAWSLRTGGGAVPALRRPAPGAPGGVPLQHDHAHDAVGGGPSSCRGPRALPSALLTFALFVGYLPVYLGWPAAFAHALGLRRRGGSLPGPAVAAPGEGGGCGADGPGGISLALTLALEELFALLWGLRGRRELGTVVALVNVLTNPPVVLLCHTAVGLLGLARRSR